jgi:hypothetical protein
MPPLPTQHNHLTNKPRPVTHQTESPEANNPPREHHATKTTTLRGDNPTTSGLPHRVTCHTRNHETQNLTMRPTHPYRTEGKRSQRQQTHLPHRTHTTPDPPTLHAPDHRTNTPQRHPPTPRQQNPRQGRQPPNKISRKPTHQPREANTTPQASAIVHVA